MGHCEDCGTRLEAGGVCPNCHEELYILRQDPQVDFSEEFCKKAAEQQREVLSRPAQENENS